MSRKRRGRLYSRSRRQHVAMRGRRREELTRRLRRGAVRLGIVGVIFGVGSLFVVHSDSWCRRALIRHTPSVTVEAPPALSALPVLSVVPSARWLLWLPGIPEHTAKRIKRQFIQIGQAHVERHFHANNVLVRLEPRTPLVLWQQSGVDREGVAFPLAEPVNNLPLLEPYASKPDAVLGKALNELAQSAWLWSQVARLKEDRLGHWALELKTGQEILWGPLEPGTVSAKAQALNRMLGGGGLPTASPLFADLRFFSEGRIIVKIRKRV